MLLFLSFVFPANLIWLLVLLHCNAMHFEIFSLGARHLFCHLSFFWEHLYSTYVPGLSLQEEKHFHF
jgi:hypothetical protein